MLQKPYVRISLVLLEDFDSLRSNFPILDERHFLIVPSFLSVSPTHRSSVDTLLEFVDAIEFVRHENVSKSDDGIRLRSSIDSITSRSLIIVWI